MPSIHHQPGNHRLSSSHAASDSNQKRVSAAPLYGKSGSVPSSLLTRQVSVTSVAATVSQTAVSPSSLPAIGSACIYCETAKRTLPQTQATPGTAAPSLRSTLLMVFHLDANRGRVTSGDTRLCDKWVKMGTWCGDTLHSVETTHVCRQSRGEWVKWVHSVETLYIAWRQLTCRQSRGGGRARGAWESRGAHRHPWPRRRASRSRPLEEQRSGPT